MQRRDLHLSNVPLSPSKYLRPVYRSTQPFAFTPRSVPSRPLYLSAVNYRRVKSKDLSPFTLPRFGRMDQVQREARRRELLLADLKRKQTELTTKAAQIHRKKQLITDLSQRFRVNFSMQEAANQSDVELATKALVQVCNRENEVSSRTIQRTWRVLRAQRMQKQMEKRVQAAAKRIQKAWRRHAEGKRRAMREEKAALRIQKHWKGAL